MSEIAEIDPIELAGASKHDDELNFGWLELDKIPTVINNPFLRKYNALGDPYEETVKLFVDEDYLHHFVKNILGIELLPFQMVCLDVLNRKRSPTFIATRGGSKSFLLAILCYVKMLLHPGIKIVVTSAGYRQSKLIFDYMCTIYANSPVLRDLLGKSGGPKTEIDRSVFIAGKSISTFCPLGDGSKIRGLRANVIIIDEYASCPPEIIDEVVMGFGSVATNPVERVKSTYMLRRLKKLGKWTDELEELSKKTVGDNQIIYAGSAFYEFNHFYKHYKQCYEILKAKGDIKKLKQAIPDIDEKIFERFAWNDFAIVQLPYDQVPENYLDAGIIAQAKLKLSRSQFLREYGARFVSDSDGFFKRSVIEACTTNKPIMMPSGTAVQFSAVKVGNKDKRYVIGIDPAADRDNAAIVVLEDNGEYRSVVYTWTTNRTKYSEYKKSMKANGVDVNHDYYRYIAHKIRQLMSVFNVEHIIMDKNGGGTAIQEALANPFDSRLPKILETIDDNDPKDSDIEEGIHILQMLAPNPAINSEANHGMLKDFQERVLLFPMFDTVELEKSIQLDNINADSDDTYEDIVLEIEALKNEISTIVVTPSSTLGLETFNTPEVKVEGSKKGRLKKDRYSALLYANYYLRNKNKKLSTVIEYQPVGKLRNSESNISSGKHNGKMYYGMGASRLKGEWMTGRALFRK